MPDCSNGAWTCVKYGRETRRRAADSPLVRSQARRGWGPWRGNKLYALFIPFCWKTFPSSIETRRLCPALLSLAGLFTSGSGRFYISFTRSSLCFRSCSCSCLYSRFLAFLFHLPVYSSSPHLFCSQFLLLYLYSFIPVCFLYCYYYHYNNYYSCS